MTGFGLVAPLVVLGLLIGVGWMSFSAVERLKLKELSDSLETTLKATSRR